jgi:hypothetical protein
MALYEEGLKIARAIGKQDLVARLLNNVAIQTPARRRSTALAGAQPGSPRDPARDWRSHEHGHLAQQHRQRLLDLGDLKGRQALRRVGGDEP